MEPKLAIQMLRGHSTLDFLKSNVLSIAGRPNAQAYTFHLSKEPAAQNDRRERFRIGSLAQAGSVAFTAFNIPMVNADNVPNHAAIAGVPVPNNGVDMLVTGMLTACSFAYNGDKTNLCCFHMQPSAASHAANKGIQLGTNLMNGGGFAGGVGGGFRVFSHREYNTCTHATVIGVRRLDGWSLYAQGVMGPTGDVAFATQLL